MALSNDEKVIVIKQFDTLCKKSLTNVVRNYYSRQASLYSKIACNDYNDYLNNYNVRDKYFQKQYIFDVEGIPVIIEDTGIAKTLLKLKLDRRKIVLLYYFAGLNDFEISRVLDIPRASVQYKRTNALKDMKIILKGGF
jgi:DNA-directed RNA polymerase specialized sigma subunit, sigma24 homolog